MRKMLLGCLVALGLAMLGGPALADPIGGPDSDCGTCQGSIYTLTYSGTALPDLDPLHETFRVTLTIDTTDYSGGGDFIDSVAIKVSSAVTSAALFSAPAQGATWTKVDGGINAGGCDGSGGGFTCADAAGTSGGAPTDGSTFAWVFDITMDNGALLTDPFEASIKARYVDSGNPAGKVGDLVSEEISLQTGNEEATGRGEVETGNEQTTGQSEVVVPGPAPLALLGLGLVGLAVGGGLRRRR